MPGTITSSEMPRVMSETLAFVSHSAPVCKERQRMQFKVTRAIRLSLFSFCGPNALISRNAHASVKGQRETGNSSLSNSLVTAEGSQHDQAGQGQSGVQPLSPSAAGMIQLHVPDPKPLGKRGGGGIAGLLGTKYTYVRQRNVSCYTTKTWR